MKQSLLKVAAEMNFPVISANGTIGLKTRADIEPGDLLLSPMGDYQTVLEKRPTCSMLRRRVISGSGVLPTFTFLSSYEQRLYMTAPSLPQRAFDDRTNTIVISWIHRNLMRKETIPIERVQHANAVWNVVKDKGDKEPIILPVEMYDSLPESKKELLCLTVKPDTMTPSSPLSVKFSTCSEEDGMHYLLRVSGDGRFVSQEGIVFIE
jgi:hypothetical protein